MNENLVVESLIADDISALRDLFLKSGSYVSARGLSDYWLYSRLFHNTCIVSKINNELVGAILAFMNQSGGSDIYIQDVLVSEEQRGKGIGNFLFKEMLKRARNVDAGSLWLTSETDNLPAMNLWKKFGFINPKADYKKNCYWVTRNLKGPGKDRVVFTLSLNKIHDI